MDFLYVTIHDVVRRF